MKVSQSKRNALSIAAGFIVAGIIFLLNSLHIIQLSDILTHLWALVFVVAGAYIFFSSVFDHTYFDKIKSRIAKKMTARYAFGRGESNILGDLHIMLTDDTIQSGRYQTLIGKLEIDATSLQDLDEPQFLDLAVAIGEIRVMLPEQLPVQIKTRNIGGTSIVFGLRKDGLHKIMQHQSKYYDISVSRLQIVCNAGIGGIYIEKK